VVGPDDFASIFEVVQRRYKRVLEARSTLPDLILIDGGKGQLHFAYQALSKLGIEDIPLASIAKREEHLFVQGQEDPVILSRRSPILQLFQEIRDGEIVLFDFLLPSLKLIFNGCYMLVQLNQL